VTTPRPRARGRRGRRLRSGVTIAAPGDGHQVCGCGPIPRPLGAAAERCACHVPNHVPNSANLTEPEPGLAGPKGAQTRPKPPANDAPSKTHALSLHVSGKPAGVREVARGSGSRAWRILCAGVTPPCARTSALPRRHRQQTRRADRWHRVRAIAGHLSGRRTHVGGGQAGVIRASKAPSMHATMRGGALGRLGRPTGPEWLPCCRGSDEWTSGSGSAVAALLR
jgi:hypothetical protein